MSLAEVHTEHGVVFLNMEKTVDQHDSLKDFQDLGMKIFFDTDDDKDVEWEDVFVVNNTIIHPIGARKNK